MGPRISLMNKRNHTMNYKNDQLIMINNCIANTFYFLEFPREIQAYWWKDRNGKLIRMSDMSLDHLNASTKMVKNSIDGLRKFPPSSSKENMAAIEKAILLPAERKLYELNESMKKRINI